MGLFLEGKKILKIFRRGGGLHIRTFTYSQIHLEPPTNLVASSISQLHNFTFKYPPSNFDKRVPFITMRNPLRWCPAQHTLHTHTHPLDSNPATCSATGIKAILFLILSPSSPLAQIQKTQEASLVSGFFSVFTSLKSRSLSAISTLYLPFVIEAFPFTLLFSTELNKPGAFRYPICFQQR